MRTSIQTNLYLTGAVATSHNDRTGQLGLVDFQATSGVLLFRLLSVNYIKLTWGGVHCCVCLATHKKMKRMGKVRRIICIEIFHLQMNHPRILPSFLAQENLQTDKLPYILYTVSLVFVKCSDFFRHVFQSVQEKQVCL